MKNYKPSMKAKNMLDHIEDNKNIICQDISRDEAEILIKSKNYINLVTPFKHMFAEVDETKNNRYWSKKDSNGRHIYLERNDFMDYYALFLSEREDYSLLYKGLEIFEMAFKSMVGYEFIMAYNVIDSTKARIGFTNMKARVDKLVIDSTGTEEDVEFRKSKMKDSFDKHIRNLEDRISVETGKVIYGTDIYIMFDRMTLNEILNIYMLLRMSRKKKIFAELDSLELTLGAESELDLSRIVFNLTPIRNCVMHFNSIEILMKYSDYKNKIIRENASRKKYEDLVLQLKKIAHKGANK